VIFGTVALISKNYKSFQFSISIFIVIWIIGEIIQHHVKGGIGLLSYEEIGMLIHVISMITFSLIIWIRFYQARRTGKNISESMESLLR
jgi:hypothetical protein